MTDNSTEWGFGATSRSKGKIAEIKRPTLYDFSKGPKPRIPKEEQAPLAKPGPKTRPIIPLPKFYDFDKR